MKYRKYNSFIQYFNRLHEKKRRKKKMRNRKEKSKK